MTSSDHGPIYLSILGRGSCPQQLRAKLWSIKPHVAVYGCRIDKKIKELDQAYQIEVMAFSVSPLLALNLMPVKLLA